MNKNTVFSEIKKYGWDAIQLTKKGYRGAIKEYKNSKNESVPVMFYIDECFVVEDSKGLFRVEDLKDFFFKHKEVNLESGYTKFIEGLTPVANLNSDGTIDYNDEKLEDLGINDTITRTDIENRLKLVYQLGETIDVDLGY